VLCDVAHKIKGSASLRNVFAESLAFQARHHRVEPAPAGKRYSLQSPEVECTWKGKAHRPHKFGR
jgi:hypothetical protein